MIALRYIIVFLFIFGYWLFLLFNLLLLSKTLGVITPTTGAGPELFGLAYQSALAFGCPSCPSLAWGGCGGREFPRTAQRHTRYLRCPN